MATTTLKFRSGEKFLKPVYVVYRHSSKDQAYPTGLKADKSKWNEKSRRFIYGNDPDQVKKANNDTKIIKDVRDKIETIVSELIQQEIEPTIQAVYKEYGSTTTRTKKSGIMDMIGEYLSQVKSNLTYNTHKKRKHDLFYFQEFAKNRNITASSFDINLYNDFKEWLKKEVRLDKKKSKKALSDNSAYTVIKTLRIYIGWLIDVKKIRIKSDYKKEFSVTESYNDNIYLTQDELKKLWEYDFSTSPDLEIVRDRFIFQCRTGLRISDLNRLDKNVHIVDNKIQIEQQKNNSYIKLPLNPITVEILNKYTEFPFVIEQVYNRMIKKCCEIAGLDRRIETASKKNGKTVHIKRPISEIISSHDSVRTFITHGIENGVTPQVMATMTGKHIQVLLRSYYKTDDQTLERESARAFGSATLKMKVI